MYIKKVLSNWFNPPPTLGFFTDRSKAILYPPELQLNKANNTDTEAPFLDLHLSIANGFVYSKIYDKRDDFVILIWKIFRFWMVTFLAVLLMVYTFHDVLGLLESAFCRLQCAK